MKKSILLLFAALLPLVASAQTKVEIDGIWYNLVSKAKQAEVTYKGDSYFSYEDEYSGSITIPATVTHNGVQYSVTSIGEGAFAYCSLTDITIPESVTSIGSEAFCDCRSLTTITIPEGVTSIGYQAFNCCTSLTAITIPASVTSIGNFAFYGCSSLTDVYCNAEEIPDADTETFDFSYIENATLHVPASAMDEYKNTFPWSSFGTIKAIENVPLEKCATPTISYVGNKIIFACDTDGAIVKSNFKDNNASDYSDNEVLFIPTYTLTAYATNENYEKSDVATLTLCWVPCEENHDEDNGILTIPAKPVLISTQGGAITLSGLAEGTEVAVVTTAGTELATATATDGTATLTTDLTAGSIAIVKIGNYSIKVAIK